MTEKPDRAGSRRRTLVNRPARIWRFVVVGCTAAAIHWSVVVALVSQWDWPPLLANVAGWLVAFAASFSGHHLVTFRGHLTPWTSSALRFFGISAGGFMVNELAYAWLIHWSAMRYDVLLAGVLVAVAGATYWLSLRWAFLSIPGD